MIDMVKLAHDACGIKPQEKTIQCPFCKEGDYDLVGLKDHLLHGDCETFNSLERCKRMF